MATLALSLAGSALGGAMGGSILGISSALIGRAVGGLIGQQIDAALFGGLPPVSKEGPRLDSLDVMTSQAGDPLADISGRVSVFGTVIWAAKLKEVVTTDRQKVGSGKRKQKVTTTTYSYFASFAVALAEGQIAGVPRIWADGRPLDVAGLQASGNLRVYSGTETQGADPTIAAIEGAAPAFRGVAYLVFTDLDVTDFGNRLPQIKAEVYGSSGVMETLVAGVNLIPGTTESGYLPRPASRLFTAPSGEAYVAEPQNTTRLPGVADWHLSLDLLKTALPNVQTVSLVVAWFGDDLRAGHCQIMPRVEVRGNEMDIPWTAAGLDRWTAPLVSQVGGRPAYGSAPSDISVIEAIQDLKARGHRVVLYPFVMMDVQSGQGLPDPSGTGTQPDFPWRGRIAPAAGQPVASEVDAFVNGTWGLRNFVTHLAGLAASAGGVDAMLIGSELVGLTMAHAGGGSFPMVDELRSIAADVRAILPAAQISYAADWSEYHSYRVGSDLFFHLDPLWSDANVDFVGIDNYLPLSDWRDGTDHLDRNDAAGRTSVYDLDYLKSNVEGGEYWSWYYASAADRDAQVRTPIMDGAHGEDWVFRHKAFRDWHQSVHRNRPGGVRSATPTAWVPGSKPIWFTELGCPAVDKGANQPNVFVSRLSSESAVPHYSAGTRDDFMQRQYLRAWLEWIDANGGGIVDRADVQIWAWDARPWPEFPNRTTIWADGPDWTLGHWLNGRAGAAPVREAVERRAARHGLSGLALDATRAHGQADGYAAPGLLGLRDYLAPFEVALGLQGHEAGGVLTFEARPFARIVAPVTEADMAGGSGDLFRLTRSALEDVAESAVFLFRDGLGDYDVSASRAVIGNGPEAGAARAESPLVLDFERGGVAAERLLRGAAEGREAITFSLPRWRSDIRPGVVVPVTVAGITRLFAVDSVTDGVLRQVSARSWPLAAYAPTSGASGCARGGRVLGASLVLPAFLDLPLMPGWAAAEHDGFLAAFASPWPAGVAVARSTDPAGGFGSTVIVGARSVMGETIADLDPDRPDAFTAGPLDVRLYGGALVSRPREDVMAGMNRLAVVHPGGVEVVGFEVATPTGSNSYRLTGLLRGDRGTETIPDATLPLPSGARVVLLDGAVEPAALAPGEVRSPRYWRYGPAGADPASHAVAAHTFAGAGLRPFAPAHLAAATDLSGDTSLSWVRRSRLAVETFADTPADPPLGETSERYRVEVGPAGAPVRVFDVTAQAAVYTAAMRAADGITAPFRVAVAQVSETYGPGSWAEAQVEL